MFFSTKRRRPTAQHVSERENIALKAVMLELALYLGDDSVITIAQAAGTDRTATRLSRELQDRKASLELLPTA